MATEFVKCNPRNDHDFNSVDVTPEQPFLSSLATNAAVQAASKRKPIEKLVKLYCRKCGEIRSL